MVDAHRTFVIVGGGLAGAKAAETLRAEGFTGRVILIGDERDHPYERPPLSKGYLSGKEERDSVFVHEPAWYAQADVELHLGQTVVAVDRDAKSVRLGDGTVLHYDKLLLATGAEPRRPRHSRHRAGRLSTICAASPTPTGCAGRSPRSAATTASCSSRARAGSAWRSPRPPVATAPRL